MDRKQLFILLSNFVAMLKLSQMLERHNSKNSKRFSLSTEAMVELIFFVRT